MASEGLASCMWGSAVTPLLFLFVMPMWVESEPMGSSAVNRLVRRHIPGQRRINVDDMTFASLRKEADKHVETFVESGEFFVNISGANASNFLVVVKTDPPPTTESTSDQQQKQLQQSTQQQPEQQPEVQQPQEQQPQVQQPPEQQQQVQKRQQLQQSELQNQPNEPPQPQKQHQPPYQRRRHHRKVRQRDAMEETEMEAMEETDREARDAMEETDREAIVMADDASSVVGKQREEKRQRRQLDEEETSSDESTYDKYFRKKTIDDYFRKSSEAEAEDKENIREKRYRVATGIETDVTMIDDVGEGPPSLDLENDVMERDVEASEVIDPEKDGTLTLNKLASVLNSNESIERLQLFSDNPSSSVRWDEPAMMTNCWLHKLLANRYSFSPSCKEDGTYYNKQCYLERCWCVDNEGRPRDRKFLTRFAYKKYGSLLYCTPQLHAVVGGNLLRPPETEFEPVVHTPLGQLRLQVTKTEPTH